MSLNCLTCQSLTRVDSDKERSVTYDHDQKPNFRLCWAKVERSWSGNIAMRDVHSALSPAKVKKARHRVHCSGPVEFESNTPRLMRSCGMRRDWSFEDLRQTIS